MASPQDRIKTVKYYEKDSVIPVEEDFLHEFKGHRNLAVEELPPSSQVHARQEKATRKAASRNINAFLNTGKGGTLYMGILDDGTVKGIDLTQYQKDHVQASLDDLMMRYSPPVKPHRYKLQFIPVLDKALSEQAKLQQCAYEQRMIGLSTEEERLRPHQLRTALFCWCDKDAIAQKNMGQISTSYVIEVHIKSWDPSDYRNLEGAVTSTNLNPIHEDEEGNAYFRRQASVVMYTMAELAELTKSEVRKIYDPQISRCQDGKRS
ncbi:uncharacterized protein LOC135465782 isoform X2 [Liolophura sinensis]|uniref:uncharacterized protein LOC135465782 isoform X2 n=1 Tax=Liolophura sinensis TaxID=3198878 RepID=UPI0031581AC2